MTAFDRFEPRLPELMTELAQPSTPDYVNDMLRLTARTRQRPAWSALERWLPVDAVSRLLLPVRVVPWRPLLVAALVVVLTVAAMVLYAGSRPSLPAPFGPARNGALLTSTPGGDIVALDPVSGATKPVLAGGGVAMAFSSNGQLFSFDKNADGPPEIWVANADGSGAHKVWAGPASTTSIDWAQDGTRLITVDHPVDGGTAVHLLNATNGADTAILFDEVVTSVAQPFGTHSLLLNAETEGQPSIYYLANDDGTNLRILPAVAPVGAPNLSPDGTRIAYASWQDGYGKQGRLHLLDLASGSDTELALDANILLNPVFSPDGTRLAARRFIAGSSSGYDLELIRVTGSEPPVLLGSQHMADNSGVSFFFSPDGAKLIARYADDSTAWLFDVSDGTARQLSGITTDFLAWQRAGE